jgi:hypothetical protein
MMHPHTWADFDSNTIVLYKKGTVGKGYRDYLGGVSCNLTGSICLRAVVKFGLNPSGEMLAFAEVGGLPFIKSTCCS